MRRAVAIDVEVLSVEVKWCVISGRGVETTLTPKDAHLSKGIVGV